MKIQVVTEKMVKPSRSIKDRHEILKLNIIDRLQYPAYTVLLFFFKGTGEGRETVLSDGVVNLEGSLSEALTTFYPLAGRYVDDDPAIYCNDEGVQFIVAMVDEQMDRFLGTRPSPEEMSALVVRRDDLAGNAPLAAIRVNVFACGGLAINIGISHVVADMCSMSMFIRSWMACCSRLENQDVTVTIQPDFNSSARFAATNMLGEVSPNLQKGEEKLVEEKLVEEKLVEEKFVSDRFSFPLENLRNEFGATRVVMVSAILSKALLNSVDRGMRQGRPSRSFTIIHAVNLRGRSGPPVSRDYFGNMLAPTAIKFILEDEKDAELQGMSKIIGSGLKEACERYSALASDGQLCSTIADSMRQLITVLADKKQCLMPFTSWCGFGLQEIDFGWGTPELTWNPGQPIRMTVLVDRSDGGIDALVSLSENDMALLKQDPDMNRLSVF